MPRTVALLVALPLLLGGCGWLTGRPFVQWSDDKAIHARVKTRLAAVSLKNLGRVNVDVYDGVAYLSGIVDTPEAKARAEAAAMAVQGVRHVVSNLVARHDIDEGAPSALALAAAAPTVPAPLEGIARLEGTRAYDRAGRHVATVYTVPMSELAHAAAQRFTATQPVDHVTVHAMTASVDVPAPHYLLVLWHVQDATPSPAR
jgi:hypothetical protein